MVYLPFISNYKPFYIQAASDTSAKDTRTEWGLVAKANPYPALPTPKDPYKNEWQDENGDDEYVASLHYDSFTFDVKFYVKAYAETGKSAAEVLRGQMSAFFSHIRDGEFKVYDSYTGLGRKKVRYAGYDEEEFKARDDWARLIFTVTFKVNDPVTFMTLSDGVITEITQETADV